MGWREARRDLETIDLTEVFLDEVDIAAIMNAADAYALALAREVGSRVVRITEGADQELGAAMLSDVDALLEVLEAEVRDAAR